MTAPTTITMQRRNKMLPLIASFKIAKAILLLLVALGFRHLRKGNVEIDLNQWAVVLRVDPDNHHIHSLIEKVTGVPASRLHELEVGTFVYAILFVTEGTGLFLQLRWAEYLTVISTLGLLPVEIYELIDRPHHKDLKALTLVINVLIAGYLIWNLRRKKS